MDGVWVDVVLEIVSETNVFGCLPADADLTMQILRLRRRHWLQIMTWGSPAVVGDLARWRCRVRLRYLMGVVSALSSVSRMKTASSLAGSVLLALRLIEWVAPGDSDQLSPAR